MASERAPISKKLRFEIFKRDRFTCQYCGQKAPDVVLHVDHVNPVFEGGTNDILNLLTSCAGCNAGKGKRKLEDQAVLEKQRAQLEELSERREQLEMMLAWREGLAGLREDGVEAINAAFVKQCGLGLTDSGRRTASKWLEESSLQETLEAVDTAFHQYAMFEADEEGQSRIIPSSAQTVFEKIPGILRVRKAEADKPYLRTLFYVRGILRKRLPHVNERACLPLLERTHLAGMDLEEMKDAARHARSWSGFAAEMQAFIDEFEG